MKTTYLFIFLFLFLSCQRNIKNDISNAIRQNCLNQTHCIINISEITDFDWDAMFLIKCGASYEEIKDSLGFEIDFSIDIGDKIFFVKSNKIIYHAEEDPSLEKTPDGYVFFDYEGCIKKIQKKNAIFVVETHITSGNKKYTLKILK